jgi:hypothetical protein
MFFYLYKTTCLITNKYYIGVHSTKKLNDGYLGSGLQLKSSIKKYGRDNHQKEILEFLSSKEEMYKREKEVITQELINNSLSMNIALGGYGGLLSQTIEEFLRNTQAIAVVNAQTLAAKEKRIKRLQEINHQQGEKNSQYGTCWVSNNVHTVKIKIELLEEYLAKGYIRGRKLVLD